MLVDDADAFVHPFDEQAVKALALARAVPGGVLLRHFDRGESNHRWQSAARLLEPAGGMVWSSGRPAAREMQSLRTIIG
jgi:hypothetical protein